MITPNDKCRECNHYQPSDQYTFGYCKRTGDHAPVPCEHFKSRKVSPIMRQFYDLKAKYPDAVLLFRCGDFYESYEQDAEICARTLGITLTKRNSDRTKLAGFPHHALDTYLPRLIRAGYRIAICDQLEDPKLTKKLVKRGITETI